MRGKCNAQKRGAVRERKANEMNLKRIDAAIKVYAEHLDEADLARLAFFRKLWGIIDETESDLVRRASTGDDAIVSYTVPTKRELSRAVKTGTPVLDIAPVAIDAQAFAATMEGIAACMVENGSYAKDLQESLLSRKWDRLVAASDISQAGTDPNGYVSAFCDLLGDDGLDEQAAYLGALVCSLALRAFLEKPAELISAALKDVAQESQYFPYCPVCGGAAGVARVGVTEHSDGRGKELWCPQCGAAWEFERVRCARCGTQNQAHLHYFNLEGDDAHRIATCDECGGFVRTVYQDSALAPFAFEVEDVVMAKLDLVALQHMQQTQQKQQS